MNIRVTKSVFRFVAFTTLVIALASCGSNSNNSSGSTAATTTTSTGTTTTTGTTTNAAQTGINLYTSICDPTTSCPADEVPYEAKIELSQQLPNGWLPVATVDTGTIGNVILVVPAGNYQLTAVTSSSSTATASAVTVTVTSGQLTTASVNFSGQVPTN